MQTPFMRWAWSKLVEEEDDDDEDDANRADASQEVKATSIGNGTGAKACPNALKKQQAKAKKRNKTRASGFVNSLVYVDGLCCTSEVPVIENILKPMDGVTELSINVAGRTVAIRHDARVVEGAELVAALNEARLGAVLHKAGEGAKIKRVPKRIILAGMLVAASAAGYAHGLLWLWKLCAVLSVILTAPKVAVRLVTGLQQGRLDMHTLILVACVGAIFMENYCEAATVLVMFSLADYIESRITVRARGVIEEVLSLRPEEAELPSGERVPVSEVPVGAVVVVRQGDSIPLDGVVTLGSLLVDESALTGEAVPVAKAVEAAVSAGTTNLAGFGLVKTTAASEDSTVSRLVKAIEQAQALRSETEKTVEKFAKIYTPAVLVLAGLLLVAPFFIYPERAAEGEFLYMTLVLLVIACPCALVISTPVTYLSGIACGATHNMLVRGGVHLEALGAVNTVALDKTGTLTEGSFELREMYMVPRPGNAMKQDHLLQKIVTLEARSSHPLALALVAEAQKRGLKPSDTVVNYEELPGEGVVGEVDGVGLMVGSERMAARLGWTQNLPEHLPVDRWARDGASVLWAGSDAGVLAVLSMADVPRPEARDAVDQMHAMGVSTVMLTGDGSGAADAVGRAVGVKDVRAALTPQGKIDELMSLRKQRRRVCMVGDGINDVPALAASNVGVAMGAGGKAAALQAADVVLMDSNLLQLAFAVRLGRCVLRKVRQNIAFAMTSKIFFMVLTLLGRTSLLGAIVVDVGSMMLVVLNGSSLMLMGRERQRIGAAKSDAIAAEVDGDGVMIGSSVMRCMDACCAPKGEEDSSSYLDFMCPMCLEPLSQLQPPGVDGLCSQCSGQKAGGLGFDSTSTYAPSTSSKRDLSPDSDSSDEPEVAGTTRSLKSTSRWRENATDAPLPEID